MVNINLKSTKAPDFRAMTPRSRSMTSPKRSHKL